MPNDENVEPEVVRAERLVAGGAALSRRDDGRIVLVDDALPGELVEVTIGRRHGADRGTVVRIVESSPDRIAPRCPHVADGCGGCDLAALEHRARWRPSVGMVTDSLRASGAGASRSCAPDPPLDPWGFRTTLRLAVTDGRAGLRRAASNDVVELDHCLVAHPLLDELIVEGRFADATEVTLRIGAATGERLALVAPDARGVALPDDVRVIGADELARRARHRRVDPRRRRRPALAHLGRVVLPDPRRRRRPRWSTSCAAMAADVLDRATGTLVDAYSGVGSSPARCSTGERVGARSPPRTTARRSPTRASTSPTSTRASSRRRSSDCSAPRADLVVADPSRAGLGRKAAAVLTSTRARAHRAGELRPGGRGPRPRSAAEPRLPAGRGRAGRPVPAHPPHRGGHALRPGALRRAPRPVQTAVTPGHCRV